MPGDTERCCAPVRGRPAFQSAPGTNAGRYTPTASDRASAMQFQSAPGTNAGRYHLSALVDWPCVRFNPRPARMPGDTVDFEQLVGVMAVSIRARHECRAIPGPGWNSSNSLAVSIRARHECRAIPASRRTWSATWKSFNPRPARMPGDTRRVPARLQPTLVSIRARHECRAIHGSTWTSHRTRYRFNPRPARMPGDTDQPRWP